MSVKPFNPNRPHGTCIGDNRFAFEQDGQVYNASHQPVDSEGRVLKVTAPAPAPAAPPPPKPPEGSDDEDATDDEKALDLLAWANGDESLKGLPWMTVRAAAADVLEDISALKSKAALRDAIIAHYAAA